MTPVMVRWLSGPHNELTPSSEIPVMKMRSLQPLSLGIAGLALAWTAVGCGASSEAVAMTAQAKAPSRAEDGVYRNAGGTAVCPVMDVVIPKEEQAPAKRERNGTTYFLCCIPCIKEFDGNPDLWAK
jgi:YHS domain-containing protein